MCRRPWSVVRRPCQLIPMYVHYYVNTVQYYFTKYVGRLRNVRYHRRVKNEPSEPYQRVPRIFERNNGPREITRENKFRCTDVYQRS